MQVRVRIDGRDLHCPEGLSLAALFLERGLGPLRHTARHGRPRGLFCGMGVCHDCSVTVDGRPGVRACVETVRDGMVVETRHPGLA